MKNGTIEGGFHLSEIFDSIEGEGKRTGYMAIFVRLAACPLRCVYCDTPYALCLSDAEETVTEEELLRRIRSYPWKRVTFTGGEPLLHPLGHICEVLGEEGYEVNIETSGAVALFEERPKGLFYTMDYKCTDSGMKETMMTENFAKLDGRDVVKFVVSSETDLGDMRSVMKAYMGGEHGPAAYVSPVWGAIEAARLVEYVREHRLENVCVQVQLHKIIWSPDRRGV